ncbi:hypothetical protein HanIR_Chr06g0258111 [Helianthus annuus]|nr:hypothetical protein HanIR_Chr06g0258111 [Helianthus annuus]
MQLSLHIILFLLLLLLLVSRYTFGFREFRQCNCLVCCILETNEFSWETRNLF